MNQDVFENLYLDLEKPLYNTVYRWVWQEDEAMDLVQEAFVKLWASREKVRPNDAKAYVFRIAQNLAANRLRARKLWKWTGLEGLISNRSQDQALLENEQEKVVRKAVESLPVKIRKVVVLNRFAEMSYREIADLLNIPEGTVGSRYHKGVQILERMLAQTKTEVKSWT